MRKTAWTTSGALALAAILIAGCSGIDRGDDGRAASAAHPAAYPEEDNRRKAGGGQSYDQPAGLFDDGFDFFGLFGNSREDGAALDAPAEGWTDAAVHAGPALEPGIQLASNDGARDAAGINVFLWRAALSTVSFMPLAQVDPFGGVIITEWYKPPEVEDERFKLNIVILGRQLDERNLRTTVLRQVRDESGEWVDAEVSDSTTKTMTQTIMVRARALHLDSAG